MSYEESTLFELYKRPIKRVLTVLIVITLFVFIYLAGYNLGIRDYKKTCEPLGWTNTNPAWIECNL